MRLFSILMPVLLTLAGIVHAQQTKIPFGGGLRADPSAPVEMSADGLNINQTDGTAVFSGNVVIAQGEMRLAAQRVLVIYGDAGKGIRELQASGGVTLISGPDAAEAREADYTVSSGVIALRGDVLLSQGVTTLSSDNMRVNLQNGTAELTGRVKTVLNAGGSE